jgi:hypothetical protein
MPSPVSRPLSLERLTLVNRGAPGSTERRNFSQASMALQTSSGIVNGRLSALPFPRKVSILAVRSTSPMSRAAISGIGLMLGDREHGAHTIKARPFRVAVSVGLFAPSLKAK